MAMWWVFGDMGGYGGGASGKIVRQHFGANSAHILYFFVLLQQAFETKLAVW